MEDIDCWDTRYRRSDNKPYYISKKSNISQWGLPTEEILPAGWEYHKSKSGKPFYFNVYYNYAQWNKPNENDGIKPPEGCVEMRSTECNNLYYFNTETEECKWYIPQKRVEDMSGTDTRGHEISSTPSEISRSQRRRLQRQLKKLQRHDDLVRTTERVVPRKLAEQTVANDAKENLQEEEEEDVFHDSPEKSQEEEEEEDVFHDSPEKSQEEEEEEDVFHDSPEKSQEEEAEEERKKIQKDILHRRAAEVSDSYIRNRQIGPSHDDVEPTTNDREGFGLPLPARSYRYFSRKQLNKHKEQQTNTPLDVPDWLREHHATIISNVDSPKEPLNKLEWDENFVID